MIGPILRQNRQFCVRYILVSKPDNPIILGLKSPALSDKIGSNIGVQRQPTLPVLKCIS